jgi:hypothetical protein
VVSFLSCCSKAFIYPQALRQSPLFNFGGHLDRHPPQTLLAMCQGNSESVRLTSFTRMPFGLALEPGLRLRYLHRFACHTNLLILGSVYAVPRSTSSAPRTLA